ncbi:MAG: hypothetical protein J7M32_05340, partial [Deltaproteobacteria bacterium]|nr:hypothetical protein [Deltaproteobacteria bacterium]
APATSIAPQPGNRKRERISAAHVILYIVLPAIAMLTPQYGMTAATEFDRQIKVLTRDHKASGFS